LGRSRYAEVNFVDVIHQQFGKVPVGTEVANAITETEKELPVYAARKQRNICLLSLYQNLHPLVLRFGLHLTLFSFLLPFHEFLSSDRTPWLLFRLFRYPSLHGHRSPRVVLDGQALVIARYVGDNLSFGMAF
jgi:hypothetical protein